MNQPPLILAASAVSMQQIFLMLVVGLTGFYMMWSTQRKLRARANSPLDRPQSAARRREEADARMEVDRLMVELQQFARDMNGQIDTRVAKLEALIRQADARLVLLRQQSLGVIPATAAPKKPGNATLSTAAHLLSAGDGSSLHRRVVALAGEGLNAQQIASQLKITPSEVELVLALKRAAARSNQAELAGVTFREG